MLETLRKQSEHMRILITVVASVIITIGIAAFWIWGVTGRFTAARERTPSESRPLAMIGNVFKEASSDIKENRERRRNQSAVTVVEDPQAVSDVSVLEDEYVGDPETVTPTEYGGITIYTAE